MIRKFFLCLLVLVYSFNAFTSEKEVLVPFELTEHEPSVRDIMQTCLSIYQDLLFIDEYTSESKHNIQNNIDCLIGKLIRLYIYALYSKKYYCSEATISNQEMHFLTDLTEYIDYKHVTNTTLAPFNINKLAKAAHQLLSCSLQNQKCQNHNQ